MTAKCSNADFENAIQSYLAGESIEKAAARFHTSSQRLTDEIKTRGLFRTKAQRAVIKGKKVSAARRLALPMTNDEIAAAYLSGESEFAIARMCGISRSAIRLRLLDTGVILRDQTEANRLLAAQTPQEEHLRRIRIAQGSTRGRKQTMQHRVRIAQTRERNRSHASIAEGYMCEWLKARGVDIVPQKAIGPYNVDIGTFPVAVEILGGNWHRSRTRHIERTRYIFDNGWNLVFVWVNATRSPLMPEACDYVVAFLDELRRNPTAASQYRVIRGDGQELARGGADFNDLPHVAPGYESLNGRPVNNGSGG